MKLLHFQPFILSHVMYQTLKKTSRNECQCCHCAVCASVWLTCSCGMVSYPVGIRLNWNSAPHFTLCSLLIVQTQTIVKVTVGYRWIKGRLWKNKHSIWLFRWRVAYEETKTLQVMKWVIKLMTAVCQLFISNAGKQANNVYFSFKIWLPTFSWHYWKYWQ